MYVLNRNRKVHGSNKTNGPRPISTKVIDVGGRMTLVLIIISIMNISNKPYQCRNNTDYWAESLKSDDQQIWHLWKLSRSIVILES
jgi:hypothetical protein